MFLVYCEIDEVCHRVRIININYSFCVQFDAKKGFYDKNC